MRNLSDIIKEALVHQHANKDTKTSDEIEFSNINTPSKFLNALYNNLLNNGFKATNTFGVSGKSDPKPNTVYINDVQHAKTLQIMYNDIISVYISSVEYQKNTNTLHMQFRTYDGKYLGNHNKILKAYLDSNNMPKGSIEISNDNKENANKCFNMLSKLLIDKWKINCIYLKYKSKFSITASCGGKLSTLIK